VSAYQGPDRKDQKAKPSTTISSCLYVAVIAVVSFLIAGFALSQVDVYRVLGLNSVEIPVINVPGTDIPQLVFQLLLAALIFFLLQMLVVIVFGFLGRRGGEKHDAPPLNPWER
jgi:hypothetical protein